MYTFLILPILQVRQFVASIGQGTIRLLCPFFECGFLDCNVAELFHRLNVYPLRVPALRQRVEDIPVLARRLLDGLSADLGRRGLTLAPEAERRLASYSWPGNIREMRNVLERALLLSGRDTIEGDDLRFEGPGASTAEIAIPGAPLTLEELEKQHIASVLQTLGGRVAEASLRLGIPRSTLYQKIKKYGIVPPRTS